MSDAATDFDPETHTLVQEFPILYGTEKNGKTKVWIAKIYLKGKHTSASALASSQIHALATIEHGQLEGKKQLTIRDYTEGKNIGKKNETTPLQQCIAETKRKWTDKHEKESYQETMTTDQAQTQASATSTTATTDPPPAKKYFPMLAHTFEPATTAAKKNNIVFPCFVQPKLDGLRCIMYRDPVTGDLHCQSRTGSYFDTMDHIKTSLAPIFAKHPNTIFDGELYTTEIPFEELAGLIKKKKLTPADKDRLRAIEYHIYDMIDTQDEAKTFEDRHATIRKIFAQNAASRMASPHAHAHAHAQAPNSDHMPHFIRLVPTTEAKTPADFRAQFSEFIEAGYEGIMLRNKKGVYRCNYRSHDLQKYKEFLEDEFPIVGFTQGDGRDKGTIIWICVTKEGKEFSVRPRGSMEHRRKLFQTGEKYVGKKLTIIYQELTEEGKPRFPVGKDVRDKY
jgi:ATP-dependent DNA ligase